MRMVRLLALLVMSAVLAPEAPLAGPRVTPPSVLAPACEAFVTGVLARTEPGLLPVRVLQAPQPKVGVYGTGSRPDFGGVKVDTVLTGSLEYQDGASRATAPLFCVGRGRKVGFYYACQRCAGARDRPILPVNDCHRRFPSDPESATRCIAELLARSETALAASLGTARLAATRRGRQEIDNLEASEREFVTYRAHSCDVFVAPDEATDAADFYFACLARLNTMRALQLSLTSN